MRNRTRLLSSISVLVIVIGAIFFAGEPQPSSGQQVQPTIDLNGSWKYMDGSAVTITHDLRTGKVTAKFDKPYPCPSGYATIDNLFNGQLKGAKLSGRWLSCNDKLLVDACSKGPTYDGDFTATVNDVAMSGQYRLPYFTWTGACQGLKERAEDPYLPLSLTRACEPDKAKRCASLARAIRSIEKIIPPAVNVTPSDMNPLPMPTVSFDPVQWKQTLAANKAALTEELDKLRKLFCDDETARNSIDKMKETLGALQPGAAQTSAAVRAEMLKIAAIDLELKVMSTTSCAVSGPPPPPPPSGICSGLPPKKPGDDAEIDEALKQINESIKETIKELEKYEREAGGASTTAGQYADYYRTKIGQLKKLKGYWDNIKAASCVPSEIIDLLKAVKGGRKDMCTRLCDKSADWIAKMYPGSQGDIQRYSFFLVCSANCPD